VEQVSREKGELKSSWLQLQSCRKLKRKGKELQETEKKRKRAAGN